MKVAFSQRTLKSPYFECPVRRICAATMGSQVKVDNGPTRANKPQELCNFAMSASCASRPLVHTAANYRFPPWVPNPRPAGRTYLGQFFETNKEASSVKQNARKLTKMVKVAFLPDKSCMSSRTSCDSRWTAHMKCLAGMVGFEPTVHCTKNSCLTTWLHPSSVALDTAMIGAYQVPIVKNLILLGRPRTTDHRFRRLRVRHRSFLPTAHRRLPRHRRVSMVLRPWVPEQQAALPFR